MKHFLILILFTSILISCKKDTEIINNPTPPIINNLICNPSFEISGHGSLNCWKIVKDFTTFPDTFSTIVPTNGGQFSLRLDGIKHVGWAPFAEIYITNLSGLKVISLSAYVMSLYGGQSIDLTLEHIRGGLVINSKSDYHWAFSGWRKFTVLDTLSVNNDDSLRVKIIQNNGQNSGAYIDLVELTTN